MKKNLQDIVIGALEEVKAQDIVSIDVKDIQMLWIPWWLPAEIQIARLNHWPIM